MKNQPILRSNRICAFALTVLLIGGMGLPPALYAEDGDQRIQVLVTYHSLTGHTKTMAEAVRAGAQSRAGTQVFLIPVAEVTAKQLFSADAVIVGSPVYWGNMAGAVKTFFDKWQFEFGVFPEFKMRDKVGAAFTTGGQVSGGKELTMITILAAMLGNHMIVVSGGGAFGASATTEGESPGIDHTELAQARALGARVADIARIVKLGRQQTEKIEEAERGD